MTLQHSNGDSPGYIKSLLAPSRNSRGSRRAWGIDLGNVWVPFFTATNVMGETNLPDDVLGAPIRLAKSPDGEVRFTNSGRPVMRVHPELNAQIGIVRENFVAGLVAYTGSVMDERTDAYRERVEAQQAAGKPILEQDAAAIADAEEKMRAQSEPAPAPGEHAPGTPEAEKFPAQNRNRNRTPEHVEAPAS